MIKRKGIFFSMLVYTYVVYFQPSVCHSWAGGNSGWYPVGGGQGQCEDSTSVWPHPDQERWNVSLLPYSDISSWREKNITVIIIHKTFSIVFREFNKLRRIS